jgi:hypothetical protein
MRRFLISAPSGFRRRKKWFSSPDPTGLSRPTEAVEHVVARDVHALHRVFPTETRGPGRSPMRIAGGFNDIGLDIPVKNQ